MANLADMAHLLRLQNIFVPPETVAPEPLDLQSGYDVNARMSELYQPESRANDMLFDMLQKFPERNKPGIGRRIVASMAGAGQGGIKAADQILYDPYYKQLGDMKAKLEPLSELASAERYGNQNMRMLANQVVGRELSDQRNELAIRKQQEIENQNRVRNDQREREIAIKMFLVENPQYTLKTREDGYIVAINPRNPTDIKVLPIRSGELSDLARMQLGLEFAIERIRTAGEEARLTKQTPSANDLLEQEEDSEKPNEKKVREYLRAREAYNTKPEWRQYIKLGAPGTNDFKITPPSKFAGISFGPDEQIYKAIQAFVYGTETPDTSAPDKTPSNKPNGSVSTTPEVKPPSQIKNFSIPKRQRAQAEREGYKYVKDDPNDKNRIIVTR